MKVNGIKVDGPRIVSLYIPINGEKVVEFRFRPLSATDNFSDVMATPTAPEVLKPGGVRMRNTDDKNFKTAVEKWATFKFHWEFLKSISATNDLEWSKVKMEDPETWVLWEEEVKEFFGKNFVNKFYESYMEANMLTEDTMEKARARFLASQEAERLNLSFLNSEPTSTESGEPAKESA